ncbi:MAG: hypothetical protein IJJ10_11550 [Bacillus sp. (in: Bacteria)]|uniref:hypothetical protein n=1 Tax=Niallia sp. FSL W8-1348 TaxID=2954656 RepID=UPI0030F8B4E6|nr:hypothetical protein [Bacillus sp. (in: firmicutes)]
MKFITPKNNKAESVEWLISERVRALVNVYSEYTGYSESEVVDTLLLNILDDKDFLQWIENKRNNRRIVKQLEIEDLVEGKKLG